MKIKTRRIGVALFALAVAILACNFPGSTNESDATSMPATFAIMATTAFAPQDTATVTASPTLIIPTDTLIPSVTPTPQNPLVLRTTLCWAGPGAVYDVVSALKKDSRVELLGRGSIAGWWVVKNPIYHDPCWVQQNDLQIDAGYDLLDLKMFYPPPTPTPTETPVPTPT